MNYNPKIKEYLETLKSISQTTDDYYYVWDLNSGYIWFFGENISQRFNLGNNDFEPVTAQDFLSIIHPNDKEEVVENLTSIKEGKSKGHNFNYRWIDKQGKAVWLNCRGKVINSENGESIMMIGSVSSSVLENRINDITGLYNKREMFAYVVKNKLLNKRGNFLFLGLDKLAKAYSEHSREYVESLVEYCGNVLEEYVSDDVKVYHVEDDVFMIYTTHAGESYATALFEDFAEKLKEKLTITGVAFSGGKIAFNEREMYKTAIKELAEAKLYNRSTLTFLTKEDIAEIYEEKTLTDELASSIANGFSGFYVVYQPQIQHGTFEIIGVEALMRYKSVDTGKEHSPAEFIPCIEQSGLMKDASLWILGESINQIKKWREYLPNLCLNVNFSLKGLKESLAEIIQVFKASGLPPKSLLIEITETVSVDEVDNVSILIRACKEAGIGISIDDFGTGYANLALLKEIKCDEIKIERTFVTGITEGSYGYLLINSLIGFSRENGIQVCCEGTETEQDVLTLARLKPDLYQGFVFDRPCTAEQFENYYIKKDTKEYQERKTFSNILKEKEKEQITDFDPKEILANVNVGLTVFYCDYEKSVFEMHIDKVTQRLLGIDKDLSPIECNDFWYSRIKKGYTEFVNKSLTELNETSKVVQFSYPWIHPKHGEVLLSFSGVRSYKNGAKLIVKSLFRVVTDLERLNEKNTKNSIINHIKNKYMSAMLGNTVAFMDINLSKNRVDGGLNDLSGIQPTPVHHENIYDKDGVMIYDEVEKWWAENYLLSDKKEFLEKSNCEYLIKEFTNGNSHIELTYLGKDKDGNVYNGRQVYYISKDEVLGDVTALCFIHDTTKEIEQQLIQKNKDNVIRSICDEFKSIIHVNLDNDSFEFFREAIALDGWRKGVNSFEKMIGLFANLFVVKKDQKNYKFMLSNEEIRRRLENQNVFKFEYERICDDEIRCHEVKVKRDLDSDKGFYVIIGVKDVERDVRLKRELKETLNMAYTDSLTELYNQQGLRVKCPEILEKQNTSSVLMFMDLDNFKSVNDIYGHATGDKVLFEVGKIFKQETSSKDVVGRYGGDEFVALIYDANDVEKENGVIDRIKQRISKVCSNLGLDVEITASIGLAFTKQTGYDYRYLKEIADDRLYIAKKQGKNRIIKNT